MEWLPPYLLILDEEWKARSKELAEWAWERLMNRKGVWGQYTSLSAREKLDAKKTYKALTLPQKKMRRRDMVTLGKLTRHFGLPAAESLDWTACVQCRSARAMVCDRS